MINKEIKTINEIIVTHINLNGFYNLESKLAFTLYNAGYRSKEDVAREIFEELSATIMPLVESHNKIAENTGNILWGHKADGLETALLALKGIIRKYGVKE